MRTMKYKKKFRKNAAASQDAAMFQGRRTRNFICVVDAYRRPSRCRSTKGVYRVGARDEKSAKKLLQSVIGFGSIRVDRQDNTTERSPLAPMGDVHRERYNVGTGKFRQEMPKHACAPRQDSPSQNP